eukprot:GHUV01025917.1.p1 GENE.GHUV01025917.1~~GHUV01025917.1.p1  ORF type:complete len:555 (+),score=211.99 GHUV01025917.1:179-1843(+)
MAALWNHQQLSLKQEEHQQPGYPDSCPSISSAMLLQYLPLPGEVPNQFLGKAAVGMLQLLQQQPCVLTESGQLAKPACTLLPSTLLRRPDGRPLISIEWLMQGLPGVEYVHPSVLADSSAAGRRAAAVLQQLGAKVMDSKTLVSWLQADGTCELLQQLPAAERTEWLNDLFTTLNMLQMQPADSPLSLADVSTWRPRLSAARILQLSGSKQLVSKNDAGQQLYIWDWSLGSQQDMELFISPSTSNGTTDSSSASATQLQFLDPAILSSDSVGVVQRLLGLKRVQPEQLVEHFLSLQETGDFTDQKHLQQLLFVFRNCSKLKADAAEQQLKSRLFLRTGAVESDTYHRVNLAYAPLAVGHNSIPAALADDLTAAGVHFLHVQYRDCAQDANIQGGSELWGWLRRLGLKDLTRAEAAKHLLSLYDSSSTRDSMTQQQHMQHLQFLAAAYDERHITDQQLQSLYVYSEQQPAAQAAPAAKCSQLRWPVSGWCSRIMLAQSIESQLRTAGWSFVHPCYHQNLGDERHAMRAMLFRAGVQQSKPLQVGAAKQTSADALQ